MSQYIVATNSFYMYDKKDYSNMIKLGNVYCGKLKMPILKVAVQIKNRFVLA